MGGEPRRTRTDNPLIKSQQGTEQGASALNLSGFAMVLQLLLSELARFSTTSLQAIVREFLVEHKLKKMNWSGMHCKVREELALRSATVRNDADLPHGKCRIVMNSASMRENRTKYGRRKGGLVA